MATSSAPIVESVRKYIAQLGNERKIGHALRRLDRFNLTEPVMAETAVGRAVNAHRDHPEHGHLARDLIEKWISIAAEAKGIVMDETTPSRKRPAMDSPANGITAASGLSFAEALQECDAPPLKKMKLSVKLTPPAAQIPKPKTSVDEADDGLFAIERKHCRSKVYSGRQKPSVAKGNNGVPTIDTLLQAPSKCTYKEAEPVLQRCTVEQLERVDMLNPEWRHDTKRLWKVLCLREFPEATARDTFSWWLSYKREIEKRDNQLATIKNKTCNNDATQPKHEVQLIAADQKGVKTTLTSCRAPLAPFNNHVSNLSAPAPKTYAPAKTRPTPLMAKALKMMKNRHR